MADGAEGGTRTPTGFPTALEWTSVDRHGKFLEVGRSYRKGIFGNTKNGKTRRVDTSDQLIEILEEHRKTIAAAALAAGRPTPELVFPSPRFTPRDPSNIRRDFSAALKKAQMRRIRFHDTRHTYASLLLRMGESLVYVKEQLGHSSIQITVDTYGHLDPGGEPAGGQPARRSGLERGGGIRGRDWQQSGNRDGAKRTWGQACMLNPMSFQRKMVGHEGFEPSLHNSSVMNPANGCRHQYVGG